LLRRLLLRLRLGLLRVGAGARVRILRRRLLFLDRLAVASEQEFDHVGIQLTVESFF